MNGKIEFAGISKSFTNGKGQTHKVFDHFSYTALPGINSILGTTGCGKTTLLKLAAGLLSPEEGHVSVGGKNPLNERAGYIPQHHTLLPWKSLRENAALPLTIRGIPKNERRIKADEALRRVGLDKHENSFPHECSGGMKQRAMLARQLLNPSRFWLMDEPFSSLDLPTRKGLQQLIRDLQQEHGLTVMIVTHDIDEAISIADHIALIAETDAHQTVSFDRTMKKELLHQKIENTFFNLVPTEINPDFSGRKYNQPVEANKLQEQSVNSKSGNKESIAQAG